MGPFPGQTSLAPTGLSKPTVNGAVELLLTQGYLTRGPGRGGAPPARPGRRGRLLRFNSWIGHVLGIDIGANKVLAFVADLAGDVVAVERRRTGPAERRDADALLALVEDAVARALEAARSCGPTSRRSGSAHRASSTPSPAGSRSPRSSAGGRGSGSPSGWSPRSPARCSSTTRCVCRSSPSSGEELRRGSTTRFLVQIGSASAAACSSTARSPRSERRGGEIGYLPLPDEDEPSDGLGPFEHAAGATAFARVARRRAAAGPPPRARCSSSPAATRRRSTPRRSSPPRRRAIRLQPRCSRRCSTGSRGASRRRSSFSTRPP